MKMIRKFFRDESGTEMVEFVVGATLIITIMTFVMVAIWNTTHARANATNTIVTDNVPTTAQP
jgi:Flp pilus assembly protein TadG